MIPASTNQLLTANTGYRIPRSLRFRSSASAYLSRTPASAGNRSTWTWSGWVKRGTLGTRQDLFACSTGTTDSQRLLVELGGGTDDALYITAYTLAYRVTTQQFRDPSAWYHIVIALDTTQSTAANRIKIYVNGLQVTSFSTSNDPALNATLGINQAAAHNLGQSTLGSLYFDGYLAEVNFIDGQALTPSSFGAFDTNGVWQPIACTVSDYGKNGFYLPFSDSANIFNDKAAIATNHSAANNWTASGLQTSSSTLTTYDYLLDSPTNYADGGNGRGNYAVLNPINAGMGTTITDGNLTFTGVANTNEGYVLSTMGVDTGSFYLEVQFSSITGVVEVYISNRLGITAGYRSDGSKDVDGVNSAYGASWTTANIIGCAFNAGTKTVTFYKDNTSQGSFTYTGSGLMYAGIVVRGVASGNGSVNFGQRPFTYTPPSGFSALNTQNLPTPTIAAGNKYFDATTYTGTAATQNIVNSGSFQPDLVWTKRRSVSNSHQIFDAIRGVTNSLQSDTTNGDTTTQGALTSFNNNGFTVPNNAYVNSSPDTFIGWQWNAGGAPTVDNTAGAGNVPTAGSVKINGANSSSTLAGSIAATRLSANTSAGFSVVTYTGTGANATVGHGLGVAPSMIIVKNRSTSDWAVYHKSTTAAGVLWLNLTNAYGAFSAAWNSTEPTSTVFSVGTATATNASSSSTHVAYCFAPVQSFSNAFSFTGNGSSDGVFIYLGFLPRMILLKRTDTTGNWYLWDTARNTYNAFGNELYPNLSNAEASATDLDVLSNGFKLRNSTAGFNASGGTYIGFAWASNPFKYSRGF